MSKLRISLIILVLTIIGGFLRIASITTNPPSLNIDEVSLGYSAYSILKTGRDENGEFMPLAFESTGDYKSPLPIYIMIPFIYLLDLNELSVRLPTALAGALSIPVFFLLLNILLKNIKVALMGALLITISPWHLYYSRYASESLFSTFLLMLGFLFFIKIFEGGRKWAVGAAVFLSLSMYTYHAQKFFIPLLVFSLILINLKKLRAKSSFSARINLKIFGGISILLLVPLIYLSVFGDSNTRAGMVFLSQDIDYTRYVILDHVQRSGENFLLLFFWVKRYLNYFQPDFLFFTGLNMTLQGTLGLGVLYLFELPFLILGIIKLIRDKIEGGFYILTWIFLGIIPASLTNNEQSSTRSLLILPALLSVVAVGALSLFNLVKSIKNKFIRGSWALIYSLFVLIILTQAFLIFTVHFSLQKGEAFMEGTKETVLYALENKEKYKEIVYDPYRGIEAPYIVNIPYMYILFYSKFDPYTFQTMEKIHGTEFFKFDKFTIRKIDWREDRKLKDVLFIGSPWSLPEKDIKNEEILKRIYLSNGKLAFFIVSPR